MKLAIELDGGQHLSFDLRIVDDERTSSLQRRGIVVVRFHNDAIIRDPQTEEQAIRFHVSRLRFAHTTA